MEFQFVKPSDAAVYPAGKDLTHDDEAAMMAQYKAQIDPIKLEEECRELLRMQERGELVPVHPASPIDPNPGKGSHPS